jgi:Leucine-rich repeat (LRR) protein
MNKPSFQLALVFSILFLCSFWGQNAHAQIGQCPRIYREGETLRTDPAQSYQWYKNGEIIPNATQQTYTPTGRSANYAVQVEGKASTPFAFELGQVTLMGQAFDEHLRPVANARIAVGNQTTQSDAQGRFQLGPVSANSTILLRGTKSGHWTSQRRITHTGRQTHVQIMLRSQPFEHELSAERGGTISRGPFFLTLQPNGVLDANNQPYTGVVKIALNGGRPDDPHFGWMMPGGDFMAQDAQGSERILQSYGFLSAHLQTPDGQPLKLDPNIGAQLRFVMPHTMVASAPDSMPLWHFDEAAGIWKEEGYARREGAAYVGTVRHFSSWNCDWQGPWCLLRGKTVDCKGRPVAGAPLRLGQQIITSDSTGSYSGRVPATLRFDIQAMNGNGKITVGPFEEGSENEVEDLMDGNSLYGYGVIDTNNVLTVRSYGTVGKAEYSIDSGATYQASNIFNTNIESSYQILVRDSMDCPRRVIYGRMGRKSACQMLDSAGLARERRYSLIEEALASNEPVYKLLIGEGSIFSTSMADCLPCLQYFGVFYSQISALPINVGNLSQLQEIHFKSNELTSLPESIGNLTQLQTLYSESNNMKTLPESIGYLSELKRLQLIRNGVTKLPASIGNLTKLEELVLTENYLSILPNSIGSLNQLRGLDLSGNSLERLPESIGSLSQLKLLGLNFNRLASLPESIGNLSQLQSLHVVKNQLSSLPESIRNLTRLSLLTLEENKLTRLPESITALNRLKRLHLSRNQLNTLPESISNLTQLQELRLEFNRLTSLPESIGNLTGLTELSLDNNQLNLVPESLGNLVNLKILRLTYNKLTSLPDSIDNLTNLSGLILSNNPIPPAEIERIRRLLPNCNVVF